MDSKEIAKITSYIKKEHPDIGLRKIEWDGSKASLYVQPTNKMLAGLEARDAIKLHSVERAATLRRQTLDRTGLDLAQGYNAPYDETPKELFNRSMRYYVEQDIYGSTIDILTNLASKGFENDSDDADIKLFYDVWSLDVHFREIINWIFFDFFRIGMVRTYKVVGKYEPGITYLSPVPGTKVEKSILRNLSKRAERINGRREKLSRKERGQKKKKWSKGYIPIGYTILNPLNIEITGSLLFNDTKVTLTPSDELRKLLQKNTSELNTEEKEIIKLLPSDFKSAVEQGGGIPLESEYVGAVDYRKMPYDRYPRPRGVKAFEAIEYKNALRQADLSTLDGITNYILKITIGNDEYPVTEQSQLQAIANLFDTSSKSFDVVWNHTLNIEKIVSPEIESILGQDKYAQVNEDITGALAFSRALIDGTEQLNQGEAALLARTITEEIWYARSQVERWIYNEYREIAESQGFDRFPKVRWDNTVLRDIILYMSTISQMVDRRMLSYRTALEQLGFEFENEFANMQKEFPEVMNGTLGIVGSPFQKSANTQPVQGAPTGTPSSGRPPGQPAKTKTKETKTNKQTKVPNQSPSNQPSPTSKTASALILKEAAKVMTDEQFEAFTEGFFSNLND
jgi:hypothetical protein